MAPLWDQVGRHHVDARRGELTMATRELSAAASAPITITSLNNLASNAACQSQAVDSTPTKYLDVHVCVTCVLSAGSPAGDVAIYVYAYSSEDGTNFSDNASGSDGALSMRTPTNLKLICVLNTPTAGGLTYRTPAIPLAPVFGYVPRKWGIVVENKSGLALAASGNGATFTGFKEAIQ